MYTEIKLLIAGCTFVLSSAIMICASITVNGSGFDILSLFLGALGILLYKEPQGQEAPGNDSK